MKVRKEANQILFILPKVAGQYLNDIQAHFEFDSSWLLQSQEAFNTFKHFDKVKSVVLFLELDWNGHKYSMFYGFDIVRLLRIEYDIKVPIQICSNLEDTKILIKNDDLLHKGNILKAPGHTFFSLINDDIANIIPQGSALDDDLFIDIKYSFFDNEGLLRDYVHQLKNELDKKQNSQKGALGFYEKTIKNSFSIIEKVIDTTQHNTLHKIQEELSVKIQEEVTSFYSKTTNPTKQYLGAMSLLAKFSERIYSLVPKSIDHELIKTRDESEAEIMRRWEVLFIDDDEHHRISVKGRFLEHRVNCHIASSYEEALSILKSDTRKKISVVISDIRLKDENGFWQAKQGYQILSELHNHYTYTLAYFALTSKKGTIINKLKDSGPFSMRWFSKEDVLNSSNGFNIFMEFVENDGEKIFYRNRNQPINASWIDGQKKRFELPLALYYKAHLESATYDREEIFINQKAKEIIQKALKHDIETPFDEELGLTGTINDKEINDNSLEKFRNMILLGRRIVLGLVGEGWRKEDIATMLVPAKYGEERNEEQLKGITKNLFSTTLCICKDDIESIKGSKENGEKIDVLKGTLLEEEIGFLEEFGKLEKNGMNVRLVDDDIDNLAIIIQLVAKNSQKLQVAMDYDWQYELNNFYDLQDENKVTRSYIKVIVKKISKEIEYKKELRGIVRPNVHKILSKINDQKIVKMFEESI